MCLAIPGRIVSIAGDEPITRLARVDFGGVIKEVNLAYVPEACVGDYILVHVGFALAVLDQTAAEHVLADLRAIAELDSATAEGTP